MTYFLTFMAGATFGYFVAALMTVASNDDRSRGYDAVLPSDVDERRDTVRWFRERRQRGR